jgi:hypothetical protein
MSGQALRLCMKKPGNAEEDGGRRNLKANALEGLGGVQGSWGADKEKKFLVDKKISMSRFCRLNCGGSLVGSVTALMVLLHVT